MPESLASMLNSPNINYVVNIGAAFEVVVVVGGVIWNRKIALQPLEEYRKQRRMENRGTRLPVLSGLLFDSGSEGETGRREAGSLMTLLCCGRKWERCTTLLLWVPAATSRQWNAIVSATLLTAVVVWPCTKSELGLWLEHPEESRFHIWEGNAFWHSSVSPWFE